jgi:hypothetical protein
MARPTYDAVFINLGRRNYSPLLSTTLTLGDGLNLTHLSPRPIAGLAHNWCPHVSGPVAPAYCPWF